MKNAVILSLLSILFCAFPFRDIFGQAGGQLFGAQDTRTSRDTGETEEDLLEARDLEKRAIRLLEQGKYAEAERLFQRVLTIREKALGPEHLEVAKILHNLADACKAQGKYDAARSFYDRSHTVFEKTLGPEHPHVGKSLHGQAGLRYILGDYAEAESLYERALSIREKALGKEHKYVAETLNGLAILYHKQGAFERAEPCYRRAIAILEKRLGSESYHLASTLNNMGLLAKSLCKYDEAESLFKRALQIVEKALGPEHPRVSISLNGLANLFQLQGKYAEAEPLYRRDLAIKEKALGPEHILTASTLFGMATLYRNQGRYGDAERLYQRTLAVRKKALGPEHLEVAESVNALARLYWIQGRYGDAEPLYRRALAIHEKVLGPNSPEVASVLNALGILDKAQGKYEEAGALFHRALEIRESALGPAHPDVAASLNNLATLYYIQGAYALAESHLRRTLDIHEKALGAEHPMVASTLGDLAVLCRVQSKHGDAALFQKRSLSIREKVFGPAHPEVAFSLKSQAKLLMVLGEEEMDAALDSANRAIEILEGTVGYPEWRIEAYGARSEVHRRKGNQPAALADLAEAIKTAEGMRPQAGGGEETLASLFAKYSEYYDLMVAWQVEGGNLEAALEYAERGRARVLLDQLAAGKVDLRSSIPPDLRTSLEAREVGARASLAEYQQRITRMGSRKDLSEKEKAKEISNLEEGLREASRAYQETYEAIKNASPLWRDLVSSGGKVAGLSTMQRVLVPEEGMALLYQTGDKGSILFVIPPEKEEPEAIPLMVSEEMASKLQIDPGPLKEEDLQRIFFGSEESPMVVGLFNHLSTATRGLSLTRPARVDSTTGKLHALWQVLVPERLWPRLVKCREVILIPDGPLHWLPFEALVSKEGDSSRETRYWLDEGPVLRYGPSATTLYNLHLRHDQPESSETGAAQILSVSDPIYDSGDLASPGGIQEEVPMELTTRGLPADRYDRDGMGSRLSRLPGTAGETEKIRGAFEDAGIGVAVLSAEAATERNLRDALQGKRYIHIATHGLVDHTRGALFAALALTPAAGDDAAMEDDGYFQLFEIYDARIPGCELAVLSACRSNVGRNVEGEGIFALSRGFLVAGAQRVVASQWNVEDVSTAELIGTFFEEVAAAEKADRSVDYATALRDAKQSIRSRDRWAAPFFWAPFILMGRE